MPRARMMPPHTSAASAICGTHFGLTNAVTSITGRCAALSRLMNSILSAVDTSARSFCSPSRGPTSTMVMRRLVICEAGRWDRLARVVRKRPGLLEVYKRGVGRDELSFATAHRGDHAVAGRAHGELHLHRLEHDDD